MASPRSPAAYTLVELLTALVLLGILAALAVPSFARVHERMRVRAALDRVAAELYYARGLAARANRDVYLRFSSAGGCVSEYTLAYGPEAPPFRAVRLAREAPGVCLSVRGSPTLKVNARGMPSGAARTVTARAGERADSLTISMVGRVYRWD